MKQPYFEASTYIRINDLDVSVRNFDAVVSRHTVFVVVVNDNPTYPVTIRGSGTLVRHNRRFYMVCCYHQIKDYDLSRVGVIFGNEPVVTTASSVRYFTDHNSSEFCDTVVFDFTPSVENDPSIAPLFFDFRSFPPNALNTDTAFIQVTGFPFHHQDYSLGDEVNRLGMVKVKTYYLLDRPSNDKAILVLKPAEKPLDFDPNGLSGGSAFSVQFVNMQPTAFFAGIISRAGANSAYMIKSNYIQSVLSSFHTVE